MKEYTKKRWQVKFRKLLRYKLFIVEKPAILTDEQKIVIDIIRKIIVKPEASILIAPLSEVRYIKYRNFRIKFSSSFASIRRGVEKDKVFLDVINGIELIKFSDRIVEKRRRELDKEYDIADITSLTKLRDSFEVKHKKVKK